MGNNFAPRLSITRSTRSIFFFSSRRRHTRFDCDWSSDVCSSDLRLPATDDPIATRVERIRQRDATVIDTVNGYYANFSDQMSLSYGQWRRASFEEIEKEQRALNQARTRTYLGAAAVLASVLVPNQCGVYDYNCQRVQSAARYGGATCGTAATLSGVDRYADAQARAHA